jgi:hypothetical protein
MFVGFWLAFGLTFSSLVSRVIYAHLTRAPFPYLLAPGVVPLFAIAAAARLAPARVFRDHEPVLVLSYLLAAAALLFHWARHAIASVCAHMGIRCLSIPAR